MVCMLAATACADGDDDESPGDAAAPATDATETSTDGNGSDTDGSDTSECESDTTIRATPTRQLETLDPALSGNQGQDGSAIQFYDSLIRNHGGQPPGEAFTPGIAESWEFETPTELHFTIREGIEFHDGTPLTAEAVKETFDRNRDVPDANPSFLEVLEPVESVEVVDDFNVIYHLSEPDPGLLLGFTYSPGFVVNPSVLDQNLSTGVPEAGAGPFTLVELIPGQSVHYERNDDFWDQDLIACAPKELILRWLPDVQARINGLLAGDLDAAWVGAEQVSTAEDAGFVVEQLGGTNLAVTFNYDNAPELRDERVRQALMYSVDREEVAAAYGEFATPQAQFWSEEYAAHDPEIDADDYPYDPERSRELLAEAGYPDGIELEITLQPTSDRLIGAEVMQAQMAEAGFDVTLTQIQSLAPYADGTVGDAYLITSEVRFESVATAETFFGPNSQANPAAEPYPDEVQAILDELVDLQLDDPGRVELERELSRIVTEDVLVFTIARIPQLFAYDECLNDVTIAPGTATPTFLDSAKRANC